MVANVNLNHPRIIKQHEDGTLSFEKLPLMSSTGYLLTPMFRDADKQEYVPFDQLGLGVTLYFKMIRMMAYVMVVATLLSFPYMFVYKMGDEANSAMDMDKMFGAWSLGNIGQSLDMCVKQDINSCSTIDIICPHNSEILKLREFGLADSSKESTCPATVANSTAIKLNLVDSCNYPRDLEKKNQNAFQQKVQSWFDQDCMGKEKCKM